MRSNTAINCVLTMPMAISANITHSHIMMNSLKKVLTA